MLERVATLPMFPLEHVLLPGEPLRLQVFEPRYRELVRDCLAGDRRFGVVLIERGSEVGGGDVRTDAGVYAEIATHRELPDGRFTLACRGTGRFRVVRWHDDAPYPRAEVDDWPDDPPAGPQAWDRALATYETAMREVDGLLADHAERTGRPAPGQVGPAPGRVGPRPGAEPSDYTFGMAGALPFAELDRYRVLTAPGPIARVDVLVTALGDLLPLLRARLDSGG